MLARIRKWGNSAAFRIPAEVMQEAQLRIDQRVDGTFEHECIDHTGRRAIANRDDDGVVRAAGYRREPLLSSPR